MSREMGMEGRRKGVEHEGGKCDVYDYFVFDCFVVTVPQNVLCILPAKKFVTQTVRHRAENTAFVLSRAESWKR